MKPGKKFMPYPQWKKEEKKKPFWQRFLLAVLGAFSALFAGGGVKKASGQFGMSISNQVRVQGSDQAAGGESNAAAPSDFNLQSEVNKQLLIEKAGAEAGGAGVTPVASTVASTGTGVSNAPSAPAPSAASTYTVKSGDTLWKIAEAEYGQGEHWTEIWQANRANISEPDLIYPGQKLAMPSGETSAKTTFIQSSAVSAVSTETQALKNVLQPRVVALNKSLDALAVSVNQYVKNIDSKTAEDKTAAAKQVIAYAGEVNKFAADVASASSKAGTIDAVVNLLGVARGAAAVANQIAPPVNRSVMIPAMATAMQTSALSQSAGEQVATAGAKQTSAIATQIIASAQTIRNDAVLQGNVILSHGFVTADVVTAATTAATNTKSAVVAGNVNDAVASAGSAVSLAIAANAVDPGSAATATATEAATVAIETLSSVDSAAINQALAIYQENLSAPSTSGATGAPSGQSLTESNPQAAAAIASFLGTPLGQITIAVAPSLIGVMLTIAKADIEANLSQMGLDPATGLPSGQQVGEITLTPQDISMINAMNDPVDNPNETSNIGPLGHLSNIGVTGSGLQGIDAAAAASLSSGITGYSGTIASVANALGITQSSLIGQLAQAGKLSPEQAAKLMSQVDEDTTNQTVDPVVSMVDTEEGLQDTSDAVGQAAVTGIAASEVSGLGTGLGVSEGPGPTAADVAAAAAVDAANAATGAVTGEPDAGPSAADVAAAAAADAAAAAAGAVTGEPDGGGGGDGGTSGGPSSGDGPSSGGGAGGEAP